MGNSCPEGYPSSLDLLEISLVMVLSPLADWKVWLMIIGMFVEEENSC